MLVHAVIALAPLGAISFILDASAVAVGGIEPAAWRLLLWGALIGILLIAIPATLTGVLERNHLYANWPPSHRAKLILSAVLVVMVASEMTALALGEGAVHVISLLGLAIVGGNNLLALMLSYFGLRITLGRQAFGSTSYVADMDRDPPVDILEVVAGHSLEPARLIDVRKEEDE
jgi:hypothetical protein